MRGYIFNQVTLQPNDPAQGVPEGDIPPGNRYSCPFCSKLVVMNDAKRMSFHIAPICSSWDSLCQMMGAKPKGAWTAR